MSIKILPYKKGSSSARALAYAIGGKRIKLDGRPKAFSWQDTVVNWGNSSILAENIERNCPAILNSPEAVGVAVNKALFFQFCEKWGIAIPKFTNDVALVLSWLKEGRTVLARRLLESHSGRGIEILEPNDKYKKEEHIPFASLYTLYQPKKTEYRVHVIGDKVVDVQEKRKSSEASEVDYKVRVHNRGWVFCREGVKAPKKVLELALDVIDKLGLDFGAVDIGWTEKDKLALCYEVNTAPGLEGTTLKIYAKALKEYIER